MNGTIKETALGALLLIATATAGTQLFSAKHYALSLQDDLASSTSLLEATTFERNQLQQVLEEKEQEIASLNKKNQKLDKKADQLTKIIETDKELLQKYSKVYFLNENYVPSKLRELPAEYLTNANQQSNEIHAEVAPYLEDLIDDAADDGITLTVTSAYRSFATQATLKSGYTVTYGAGTANQFSAEQGYSEHQLGTAVDFGTPGSNLTISFENTAAFKWLNENAYRYGFILSYPKGNTYYQYEPWHWRFVGKDLARRLHRNNQYFYDMDQRDINEYLGEIFD